MSMKSALLVPMILVFVGCTSNSWRADHNSLCPSVSSNINQCHIEFTTENWYGRIDETADKPSDAIQPLRLTLWKNGKSISEYPDVSLYGVECQDGSCGAGYYMFLDSGYSFDSINITAYVFWYSCTSDDENKSLAYHTNLPIRHISDSTYVIDDNVVDDVANLPWNTLWEEYVVEKKEYEND